MLVELLKKYKSVFSEENVYKEKMLEVLFNCDNCFERSCAFGHFTASAWLLNKDKTKVLLMHHKKLDKWMQFGGHCDGDNNVLRVAIKEAQEESGIMNIKPVFDKIFDLDMHLIPKIKDEEAHYHFDVRFLLQVVSDEKFVKNNESKDLKWFNIDDNIPTSERSVTRMLDKWKKSLVEKDVLA